MRRRETGARSCGDWSGGMLGRNLFKGGLDHFCLHGKLHLLLLLLLLLLL